MFNLRLAFVFITLISFSYSQYTSRGQCEDRDRINLSVAQWFNLRRFAGNGAPWYPIASYSSNLDCLSLYFTETSTNTMNVVYTQKNLTTGVVSRREGKATWVRPDYREAIISVNHPYDGKPLVYRMVLIVYDEFTAHYSCVNLDKQNRQEFLHLMSRNRTLTSDQQRRVRASLERQHLPHGPMVNVVQDPTICSI
ncbi:uncharacterized protein LOC112906370 [Agrilus planipennis]|uniref:Uncharacterized protein LOC112906370 n=1 Tax=Agrilus planipennis TaxID=224129 RepID=A0A7F5RJE2_AGRPL|nr:uncharacterized protein LOC112906370 [Agrilus planipennis]